MKKLICHCGAVEAEINLDGDLAKVIKCNCSICKRKGAIMSMVKNEDFKITKGKDKLKLYQFHLCTQHLLQIHLDYFFFDDEYISHIFYRSSVLQLLY